MKDNHKDSEHCAFRFYQGQLQHIGSKLVISRRSKITNHHRNRADDNPDLICAWYPVKENKGALWTLVYVDGTIVNKGPYELLESNDSKEEKKQQNQKKGCELI